MAVWKSEYNFETNIGYINFQSKLDWKWLNWVIITDLSSVPDDFCTYRSTESVPYDSLKKWIEIWGKYGYNNFQPKFAWKWLNWVYNDPRSVPDDFRNYSSTESVAHGNFKFEKVNTNLRHIYIDASIFSPNLPENGWTGFILTLGVCLMIFGTLVRPKVSQMAVWKNGYKFETNMDTTTFSPNFLRMVELGLYWP